MIKPVVINDKKEVIEGSILFSKSNSFIEALNNREDDITLCVLKADLKIFLRVLLVILIIIVILAGIAAGLVAEKLGKINVEEIDKTAIGISEETKEELSGYRNIALFGVDSRADDYGVGNRSDCIMIASMNQKTNDIKIISVYRDTYMQVEEKGKDKLDKVTHAYAYGGPQGALKALNTNLDLNISEYVTANFDAVIAAVDAVGGVTIDVDISEVKYINKYINKWNVSG